MNCKSFTRLLAGLFCFTLLAENPIVIRSGADAEKSPHDNLKSGVPSFRDVVVYDRSSYAVGFSKKFRQPVWVQYVLTREEVQSKNAKRTNLFRIDPDIPGSLAPDSFSGTGYDRGHLAPAGDMSWSAEAMADSFLMSNMTLQHPSCNRQTWLMLEDHTRAVAEKAGRVIVTTGVIFGPEKINGLQIPVAFFKILRTENSVRAYLVPNKKSDLTIEQMQVAPELMKSFF